MRTNPPSPRRSTAKKNLANRLADLGREDLSTLLTELVQRHPELYDWLEAALSIPTRSRDAKKGHPNKVDADGLPYRRQVIGILHSYV